MRDRYPTRNSQTAWRIYDGEAVILLPDDSTLNTLNPVGTLIWEAADGKTRFSVVVDRICEQFDVDRRQAETDATAFIEKLCQRSLLTVSEMPQHEREEAG